VVILYLGLGITTILVLRQMSRRFREGGRSSDADVPYGPSEPDRADLTGEADAERKVPLG